MDKNIENDSKERLNFLLNQTNDFVTTRNMNQAYRTVNEALNLIIQNPTLKYDFEGVSILKKHIAETMIIEDALSILKSI